jgi:glycosyltransferase involved in cell wall biosynthesis
VTPTVSVIMPVLDRAPLIAGALESIAAQTLVPMEVLVVDGGSTDPTPAIARRFATVLVHPGTSTPEAHNIAMAAARGSVLAFASSDDIVEPDALERHILALDRDPSAGLSVGLTRFFADGSHARTPAGLPGSVRRARVLEAVAVRREVVLEHGVFRPDLGPSADLEWMARLADGGVRVAEVDAVVVRKRLHSGNTTYARDRTGREVIVALRATLERRREHT